MTSEDKAWNVLTIRLARDAEELAVALLFDLGATGTVTLDETAQSLEIAAYFQSDTSSDAIVGELKKRLGQASLLGSLQAAKFTRIQDEDWLQ